MNRGNIHEKCVGCARISKENICLPYRNPSMWWEKFNGCPLATHIERKIEKLEGKQRIGQQKQKKKKIDKN